jgi:hypothetical protein
VSARLLIALTITLVASGCIRRYPPSPEPADPITPYSAFAALHEVTPPSGPAGDPLPEVALRLAVSGVGWLADTMLVDGEAGAIRDGTGDPAAALELLADRPEPVVVLIDAERIGDPVLCEVVALLGERARVATGTIAYGRDAAPAREPARGVSRDPLGGVSGDRACGRP